MNTILPTDWWSAYILPSGVALAVFYLFYKGLVRNDTHLNSRRFVILGFLIFAMALPFLNFEIPVNTTASERGTFYQNITLISERTQLWLNPVTITAKGSGIISILSIINWIYGAVVLILVGRWFVGILRLAAFSRNGKRLPTKNATIILCKNIPTAFSFFNRIFIPETWYNSDERDFVLRHEHTHVKQKHSWDLMLMEIVCAVQFFNPFVWLLKREMRMNHEFLADQGALENGGDKQQYFQVLLQKIIGKQPILVHSFNYSPLKHRIMMQLTKPAKMLSQTRYLAFVPVALMLTILFAFKGIPNSAETIVFSEQKPVKSAQQKTTKKEGQVFAIVEENPSYSGGESARQEFLAQHIKYPEIARNSDIQAMIFVSFIVETDGKLSNVKIVQTKLTIAHTKIKKLAKDEPKLKEIAQLFNESALSATNQMPAWIPGKEKGQSVRVHFMMPIKFTFDLDKDVKTSTITFDENLNQKK